ncbi:GNAT family N-acetyltransferase [Lapidilactobacillus wuchangensis]|uniref:GNAT family N-acetyltransferase n=1 Tax=Lapidilactobacillus wuchangensis TaxID=2486001 RepID=UPI0013DE02E8|nr:GNAT family N-acetyltransferase [Lapidilactobacillus wuchangensis]
MFTFSQFQIQDHLIKLAYPDEDYAAGLYEQVVANRDEFSRWLPWATLMNSAADEAKFLAHARAEIATNDLILVVILVDNQPAGMLDLHNISALNRQGEIGYWLAAEFQGHGIMTAALLNFADKLFTTGNFHKLLLLADQANHKSRAVATRSGFRSVGQLKEHLFLAGKFDDAELFELVGPLPKPAEFN